MPFSDEAFVDAQMLSDWSNIQRHFLIGGKKFTVTPGCLNVPDFHRVRVSSSCEIM
jgi:hypothetical protein